MTRNNDACRTLEELRVVPVISIDRLEDAMPLADALVQGGLPVAEITFRTAAAGDVIATLSREMPELLVGAGTILTVENLRRAVDSGARFGVAPGLNPEIVQLARDMGFPFFPGVVTPSEIEQAIGLGAKIVKFFPAELSGGVPMLKMLAGPYAHTGLRFLPTGGVSPENLADYLSVPSVMAVGGTWIAKKEDITAGNWDLIRDNCQKACQVARSAQA